MEKYRDFEDKSTGICPWIYRKEESSFLKPISFILTLPVRIFALLVFIPIYLIFLTIPSLGILTMRTHNLVFFWIFRSLYFIKIVDNKKNTKTLTSRLIFANFCNFNDFLIFGEKIYPDFAVFPAEKLFHEKTTEYSPENNLIVPFFIAFLAENSIFAKIYYKIFASNDFLRHFKKSQGKYLIFGEGTKSNNEGILKFYPSFSDEILEKIAENEKISVASIKYKIVRKTKKINYFEAFYSQKMIENPPKSDLLNFYRDEMFSASISQESQNLTFQKVDLDLNDFVKFMKFCQKK